MVENQREIESIAKALNKSWSIESSSKWTIENPAKGHCGVTSLVVNDLLGGKIVKTKLPDGWHFYNLIDGNRYDFTSSQFKKPILYMDIPSDRKEAYLDTNEKQYASLRQRVITNLHTLKSNE